jgi:hypothetical protein
MAIEAYTDLLGPRCFLAIDDDGENLFLQCLRLLQVDLPGKASTWEKLLQFLSRKHADHDTVSYPSHSMNSGSARWIFASMKALFFAFSAEMERKLRVRLFRWVPSLAPQGRHYVFRFLRLFERKL